MADVFFKLEKAMLGNSDFVRFDFLGYENCPYRKASFLVDRSDPIQVEPFSANGISWLKDSDQETLNRLLKDDLLAMEDIFRYMTRLDLDQEKERIDFNSAVWREAIDLILLHLNCEKAKNFEELILMCKEPGNSSRMLISNLALRSEISGIQKDLECYRNISFPYTTIAFEEDCRLSAMLYDAMFYRKNGERFDAKAI